MTNERMVDEVFCQHCGDSIKKQAEICPNCGVRNNGAIPSRAVDIYCRSCGDDIKSNAEICPNCGVRNGNTTANNSTSINFGMDTPQAIATGLGSILILAGFGTFSEGSTVTGLLYLVLGLVLLPQLREKIRKEHTITTVGYVKSVSEKAVRKPDVPCGACQSPIGDGIRRRYAKQFVLFGISVFTAEGGQNTYCQSCAYDEIVETSVTVQD